MTRVLIVEDEPSVAEMLEMICSFNGLETRTAANGSDALGVLADYQPDLILTDFMMPKMDGCEFLTRVRANPAWRELPVLILTAAPETAARRCVDSTIIPKPVDLDDLVRMLRRLTSSGSDVTPG